MVTLTCFLVQETNQTTQGTTKAALKLSTTTRLVNIHRSREEKILRRPRRNRRLEKPRDVEVDVDADVEVMAGAEVAHVV